MKRLHPVIVLIRSFLVFSLQIASLVAANPALASSCYDCCNNPVYSTHTSPQINGQITNYGGDPGPLEICEGQSIYLYASTTDKDKVTQYCHNSPEHCFGGPETFTSYPNDGSSADWSSNNGGSFDDPTYRNSVLWTAPTLGPGECSRTVTITATATDGSGTCPGGSCNSGNCNDGPGEQDTITIVVKKSICESATVTTTVGAFTPDPICVGETITPPATHAQACSLSASHDVQCICDEDIPTWSWQVWEVKKDGVNVAAPWHYLAIDHPDNTSSSATLKATFPSCGKWEVAVRATFFSKSECCNNQCATIGDVKWTPVTKVVGVDRIIVQGSNPEDTGPVDTCIGDSVTLEAKPCPDNASFPASKPVWTVTSKPTGSTVPNNLGNGPTATITPDVKGTYVVKAECGSSSDTITITAHPKYCIQVTAWIPFDHVEDIRPLNGTLYKGDAPNNVGAFSRNRTSFRMRQHVTVIPPQVCSASGEEPGSNSSAGGSPIGQTESFDPSTSLNGAGFLSAAALADGVKGAPLKLDWATTTATTDTVTVTRLGPSKVQAYFRMGAPNPLVTASPDIDWEVTVVIDASVSPATYTITGSRDGFPAHDVYIENTLGDSHDPRVTGEGLGSLPWPMEHTINANGTLPCP